MTEGGPKAAPGGREVATIVLLAAIWGLSIPLTKLGLETTPPLTLTALRFAAALPPLFLLSRGHLPPRGSRARVFLLGIIGISVGQVAQTLGIEGTSASVGAILSATIPIFVVAFAALRLRQRVMPRQMLGLLAAFGGIALVASASGDVDAAGRTSIAGVAWMLVSSIAIAFYYVWSVELTRDFGTPTVAAFSTLAGLLALAPWTAWELSQRPASLTLSGLAVAAYLGVFVTAAGLYLWLYLLNTVGAVVATTVQYLHPIVGILVASLMFGDALGARFAGGVALILTGLALVLAPRRRRRTNDA